MTIKNRKRIKEYVGAQYARGATLRAIRDDLNSKGIEIGYTTVRCMVVELGVMRKPGPQKGAKNG